MKYFLSLARLDGGYPYDYFPLLGELDPKVTQPTPYTTLEDLLGSREVLYTMEPNVSDTVAVRLITIHYRYGTHGPELMKPVMRTRWEDPALTKPSQDLESLVDYFHHFNLTLIGAHYRGGDKLSLVLLKHLDQSGYDFYDEDGIERLIVDNDIHEDYVPAVAQTLSYLKHHA